MDWLTKELVISVVGLLISVASLVVAGISAYFTRGNQKATERSAGAAQSAADASGRAAEAAAETLERNKRSVSVELVNNIQHEIATDEEVRELLVNLRCKQTEITAGHKEEKILRRMLARFAIVANAWEQKLINDSELDIILDDVLEVMNSPAVKKHLNCRVWERKEKTALQEPPYRALMELVKRFSPEEQEEWKEPWKDHRYHRASA